MFWLSYSFKNLKLHRDSFDLHLHLNKVAGTEKDSNLFVFFSFPRSVIMLLWTLCCHEEINTEGGESKERLCYDARNKYQSVFPLDSETYLLEEYCRAIESRPQSLNIIAQVYYFSCSKYILSSPLIKYVYFNCTFNCFPERPSSST